MGLWPKLADVLQRTAEVCPKPECAAVIRDAAVWADGVEQGVGEDAGPEPWAAVVNAAHHAIKKVAAVIPGTVVAAREDNENQQSRAALSDEELHVRLARLVHSQYWRERSLGVIVVGGMAWDAADPGSQVVTPFDGAMLDMMKIELAADPKRVSLYSLWTRSLVGDGILVATPILAQGAGIENVIASHSRRLAKLGLTP